MKTFEFIFGNFWHWLGFMIKIFFIGKYLYIIIYNFYQRTLRHFIMLKYGYPPHCDADGNIYDLDDEN